MKAPSCLGHQAPDLRPAKLTRAADHLGLCRCNQVQMESHWIQVGPKSNKTEDVFVRSKLTHVERRHLRKQGLQEPPEPPDQGQAGGNSVLAIGGSIVLLKP